MFDSLKANISLRLLGFSMLVFPRSGLVDLNGEIRKSSREMDALEARFARLVSAVDEAEAV